MKEMIEQGFFYEGEYFCLKTGNKIAKLCGDGKLLYNGQKIDMHSCAAIAKKVKATRLNGFEYWYVLREGNLVSISKIRDSYRELLKTNSAPTY